MHMSADANTQVVNSSCLLNTEALARLHQTKDSAYTAIIYVQIDCGSTEGSL